MFPPRYFPPEYWPPEYWAKFAVATGVPVVEEAEAPVRVGTMSGQQIIQRFARGLRTWPNRLASPEGCLLLAQDAQIERDGMITSRRGFSRHASAAGKQLFEYLFRLVILEGNTLKYDDGLGNLTSWAGSHEPPPGSRMRGLEIDEQFLFTTAMGPYIQESAGATPRRSGMPRGLDVQLVLTGTGGSWSLPDTQVGYRIVWGKDERAPGAPSFLAIIPNAKTAITLSRSGTVITVSHTSHGYSTSDTVEISDLSDAQYENGPHSITVTGTNSYTYTVAVSPTGATATGKAGKKFSVQITSTIPAEAQVGWWYEVYRTTMSASATATPFNDGRKIIRVKLTSSDITNGYVTFTDTFDEVDRASGIELYTNEGTQEGETQANDRPPYALFIVSFRGHTWYFNIRFAHKTKIQLFSTDGLVDDTDAITVNVGSNARTYTFSATEALGALKFKRHTIAGEGSKSLAVRKTAQSLAKVINRDSGSQVYAYYASGAFDPPGTIILERRDLSDSPFHLTATTAASLVFTPLIPTSGTSLISDASKAPHRAARSKFQKLESVPELNTMEIGRLGFAIQGGAATKEALIVPTEAGLWEITGETDKQAGRSFIARELDPELVLLQPDTFVPIDNVAIGWFEPGVCRVSSGGATIISNKIKDLLDPLISLSNFSTAVFAVPYPSQQLYILYLPSIGAEDKATRSFVYHTRLNEWAGPWRKVVRSAVVLHGGDDRLYMAHGNDDYILKERKDFSNNDLVDEDIGVTVTGVPATVIVNGVEVSKVTVTYTYAEALTEGWLFTQDPHRAVVDTVTNNGGGSYTLRLDRKIPIVTGSALLSIPIETRIEWLDQAAGNVGLKKQFDRLFIYHETSLARHHYVGVISNVVGTESWSPRIDYPHTGGWGSNWGGTWGDPLPSHAIPVIAEIPTPHRRCETLRPMYRHKWALEPVQISQLSIDFTQIGSRVNQ